MQSASRAQKGEKLDGHTSKPGKVLSCHAGLICNLPILTSHDPFSDFAHHRHEVSIIYCWRIGGLRIGDAGRTFVQGRCSPHNLQANLLCNTSCSCSSSKRKIHGGIEKVPIPKMCRAQMLLVDAWIQVLPSLDSLSLTTRLFQSVSQSLQPICCQGIHCAVQFDLIRVHIVGSSSWKGTLLRTLAKEQPGCQSC